MTFELPDWLARLLGIDASPDGQATYFGFDVDWPGPVWLAIVLALCAVLAVLWSYRSDAAATRLRTRLPLAAIRLSLVAIVALMIGKLSMPLTSKNLPYVVVVLDVSGSMSETSGEFDSDESADVIKKRIENALGDTRVTSRLNIAKSLLLADGAELLDDIADQYRIKIFFVADGMIAAEGDLAELKQQVKSVRSLLRKDRSDEDESEDQDIESQHTANLYGDQSYLGESLRKILADLHGNHLASILYFTDGNASVGHATLGEVTSEDWPDDVPLFIVGVGKQQPNSLKLRNLEAPKHVFVGDLVRFRTQLTTHGFSGKNVKVTLNARPENSSEPYLPLLTMTESAPGDDDSRLIELLYRPEETGRFTFSIQAELTENSERIQDEITQVIEVVDRSEEQFKTHVVMLQAYPSYEFRYLKHMFERDDTVRLTTVLQSASDEYAAHDKTSISNNDFLRLADQLFQPRMNAAPQEDLRDDQLPPCDVLIIGDADFDLLDELMMNKIRDFVKVYGKGVAFIAGPRFNPLSYGESPLAALVPIEISTAKPLDRQEFTDREFRAMPRQFETIEPILQLGINTDPKQNDVIWKSLPPIHWAIDVGKLKPGVRILVDRVEKTTGARATPLICTQHVGAGRVLFHAFDGSYRWGRRNLDVVFARYWIQAVRHLADDPSESRDFGVELTTDRNRYRWDQTVQTTLVYLDPREIPGDAKSIKAQLDGPEIHKEIVLSVDLNRSGHFHTSLRDLPEGDYEIRVELPNTNRTTGQPPKKLVTRFIMLASPAETDRLPINVRDMQIAARRTGGKYLEIDVKSGDLSLPFPKQGTRNVQSVDQLTDLLPEGMRTDGRPLGRFALWKSWPVATLFLALLLGEWLGRKRKGML